MKIDLKTSDYAADISFYPNLHAAIVGSMQQMLNVISFLETNVLDLITRNQGMAFFYLREICPNGGVYP